MLARHKKHFLAGRLQNLIHCVELLWLRQVADISRMQQELRRPRKPIDFVHCGFQRSRHVRVGRLVESHVAVADLHEAQFARSRSRSFQLRKPAQAVRLQYAALHHAKRARARPRHALQKAASIDTIVVVIVHDLIFHSLRHFLSPTRHSRKCGIYRAARLRVLLGPRAALGRVSFIKTATAPSLFQNPAVFNFSPPLFHWE